MIDDASSASATSGAVSVRELRREGRHEDAIVAAEGCLYRTVVASGSSSPDAQAVAVDLVLAYNQVAMKMLSTNDMKVTGCVYTKHCQW